MEGGGGVSSFTLQDISRIGRFLVTMMVCSIFMESWNTEDSFIEDQEETEQVPGSKCSVLLPAPQKTKRSHIVHFVIFRTFAFKISPGQKNKKHVSQSNVLNKYSSIDRIKKRTKITLRAKLSRKKLSTIPPDTHAYRNPAGAKNTVEKIGVC